MNELISSEDERIRLAAEQLFAQAEHYSDLTRSRILELAGVKGGRRAFEHAFPGKQFTLLRREWFRTRIEVAMDIVFATAKVQRDVTFQKVADLAGCSDDTVISMVGPQFLARRAALEDSQERMLQAIERLVEAHIPPQEYTWPRVYAEADERPLNPDAHVKRAFRDGLESLVQYHEQQQQQRIPGATYACVQDTWVNVDEPIWFLPGVGRIRYDRLRPDIAAIAWPLLREEALSAQISGYTLRVHYSGCISIAQLLSGIVPDIRAITLNAIEQAWLRFEASTDVRKHLRTMLVRILEALIAQGATGAPLNVQEYGRVVSWLQMINLNEPISDKDYLSESEFDTLLDGCLEDIVRGLAYTQQSKSTIEQKTGDIHTEEAVFHWGVALIILVMAFTGLRRQSIARLTVDDIAQIGPDAFALAWRHGKPGKERIAIIPALVAEHLSHYIRMTTPVREHLNTQQLFLGRNRSRRWDHMTVQRVTQALDSFCYRHTFSRDGVPLRLGSTLLRRTYVTRALYELPSIAALQAQLGHDEPRTTLGYAQHDRFEHPAQVDNALDGFGRKVLVRWHTPLLLDDLPDKERQELLGARLAHEQDVGLCRHNSCVKLNERYLPPCSLCEHLVSGPEYLMAWEREKRFRELQMEHLTATPGSELLLAQMKGQYDRFQANYQFVQEGNRA